jgi:hypothetical protein
VPAVGVRHVAQCVGQGRTVETLTLLLDCSGSDFDGVAGRSAAANGVRVALLLVVFPFIIVVSFVYMMVQVKLVDTCCLASFFLRRWVCRWWSIVEKKRKSERGETRDSKFFVRSVVAQNT